MNLKEENKKKKKILKKYITAKHDLEEVEMELEELEDKKMYPSFSYDGMPHGSGGTDLSDYAAKYWELHENIINARYQKIKTMNDIVKSIEAMEDERERIVLKLIYIRKMTLASVGEQIGLEWAQVSRIHSDALKHFELREKKVEVDAELEIRYPISSKIALKVDGNIEEKEIYGYMKTQECKYILFENGTKINLIRLREMEVKNE